MATATVPVIVPRGRRGSVVPGFGLTLGFAMLYLSIIVLLPLSTVFVKSAGMGPEAFARAAFNTRTLLAYRLSFGAAAAAAAINMVTGLLIAWVLVRYEFPGKRIISAMVDLPFALPTAVAGIALTAIYADTGLVGSLLAPLGIKIAYTRVGIVFALIFIGLPFVVRSVEPVLADVGADVEEAAASLGAGRFVTFWRVILPAVAPALITGFALAFARGIGEYGSIIFIAGNMPFVTEIAPLRIVQLLEEFDYAGATAVAAVMLFFSFGMLLVINLIQVWARGRMS